MNEDAAELDRRQFLQRALAALASVQASLWMQGCQLGGANATRLLAHESLLSTQQQRTLAAIQEVLLPSEATAPGATEVNASQFVSAAVSHADFDADVRSQIIRGLDRIHQRAQELHGHGLEQMTTDQRDTLLRSAVNDTSWGEDWVSVLISYTLEAALCDPVYGGNPGQVGWRWLGHVPGFPQPPYGKRFDRL